LVISYKNKRGVWKLGLSAVAVFMIITGMFLLLVLPELQRPGVNYEISLQNNKIIQGNAANLLFKINNNLEYNMTNLNLKYEILNTQIQGTTNIGVMAKKSGTLGNVNLHTEFLSKGAYTVQTIISFNYDNKTKEIPLTIGFEIY